MNKQKRLIKEKYEKIVLEERWDDLAYEMYLTAKEGLELFDKDTEEYLFNLEMVQAWESGDEAG